MNRIDWDRFRQSVDWAVRNIEKDAFCFSYTDEAEYVEFIDRLRELQRKTFDSVYLWSEPIITADTHDLLHVSRIDTGELVLLPVRVPVDRKLPTLIQCKVYRLDTGLAIAVGKYEDLTIIFQERRDYCE